MKIWSKDMAMRLELIEWERHFKGRRNICWVTYYTGVISNLSSGTLDRGGILIVIWWGMMNM